MTVLESAREGAANQASRLSFVELLLVLGAVAVAVAVRAPSLDQPLLEHHSFRQTQTAYTALVFDEQGIDLLHPKLPVLGAPFEVPFEFPLFQAAAAVVMKVGVDPDVALRLTCLACFAVTALLLYALVRRVATRIAAAGALVAFLASPFALVWSRTSMIEFLATAGALGFCLATIGWRERRRPWLAVLALGAGLVGLLVKPTTAVFWILPALLYRPASGSPGAQRSGRLRVDPVVVALVAVPILAMLAWTRHADGIKAASPATSFLTSEALRTWNFGTWAQRLDPDTWWTVARRTGLWITGLGALLLPFAAVSVTRSRQWPFWVGVAGAAILPPIVFTNLFVVHDYYLCAVLPALAAFLGLGAGWLIERIPRGWAGTAAVAGATLLVVVVAYATTQSYWRPIYDAVSDPEEVLPLADEIRSSTTPDELVGVLGRDWSPAPLYYARRWGQMLPSVLESPPDYLLRQGYRVLAVSAQDGPIWFLHQWPWVGLLGPRLYSLGRSLDEIRTYGVVATDDGGAFDAAAAGGEALTPGPVDVPCDGHTVRVPAGDEATWLRVEGDPSVNARLWIGEGLLPLPVRTVTVVDSAVSNAELALRCDGTDALRFTDVVSAPFPA